MSIGYPVAVLFDLDGTLLDGGGAEQALVRTCHLFATESGTGLEPEVILDANREVWETYWPEIENQWPLTADGEAVMGEAWRRTLSRCGLTDEALVETALQTHRRLEREAFRLFDDAKPTMRVLHRAGIALGLVTNGASDVQRDKLEILSLGDWFNSVVISSEVGAAKPDPTPFLFALKQLRARPEDSWHVGDNPVTDVAGAKAAGLSAVWLNRPGLLGPSDGPAPDVEIQSLTELRRLL